MKPGQCHRRAFELGRPYCKRVIKGPVNGIGFFIWLAARRLSTNQRQGRPGQTGVRQDFSAALTRPWKGNGN